jgi:hypothetical protein
VDSGDWTLLSLWIHVPLVTVWVGLVMFDVFAAFAPSLEMAQRARLITWSRPFVIVAIILILVTGIWQTMENPFLQVRSYAELEELRERTYGLALFWKHGFVLLTFVLTVVVRFFLAPRLATEAMTATTAGTDVAVAAAGGQTARAVRWLSLLNLAACLGALVLATSMVWQLH